MAESKGSNKKVLKFTDLVAVDDKKLAPLDVEEWGGVVFMRLLAAKDAMELGKLARDAQKAAEDGDDDKARKGMYRLLMRGLANEDGTPFFPSDVPLVQVEEALGDKAMVVLTKIQDALLKHNGMHPDQQKKGVEEEIKKN